MVRIMKKFKKSNKLRRGQVVLVLLAVLFFIAGIPLIINESYKANVGYMTLWDAADALSYYGMIVAAVGTGIGVFITVRYSQKQYQEDRRQRVIPFFAINMLGQKRINPFLKAFDEDDFMPTLHERNDIEESKYREYHINRAFFFIEYDEISYSPEIDEERRAKAEMDESELQATFKELDVDEFPFFAPFHLKNVGTGCAVNMTITIDGGKERSAYSPPISISVDDDFYFYLYIEKNDSLIGDYAVTLSYQDILGNLYDQCCILKIYRFYKQLHAVLEIKSDPAQRLIGMG